MLEGEVVRWSADGTRFAVTSQSNIDVYTTVGDYVLQRLCHQSEEFLLIGYDLIMYNDPSFTDS